jgi:four helix bundle protein
MRTRILPAACLARLLVSQLLGSTLSFATMLEEARGAESDADFISKCSISLKECRESWTRLRVCSRCAIGSSTEVDALVREGNELIAIVTSIVKNKRRNVAANKRKQMEKQAAHGKTRRKPM